MENRALKNMKELIISCENCEHCQIRENENSIISTNYICVKNDIDIRDIEQEYCSDFEPV